METLEEIRANSRTIEAADTRCGDCNDWLSDHPQCDSCGKVPVCSGLCGKCTERSKAECADAVFRLEPILRDMKAGLMLADEAGDLIWRIGDRLSRWDVGR